MARILLLDPDERTRLALKGILGRGGHRLATAAGAAEAWSFIQRNPAVDLVFSELRLSEGDGLSFVQRLKHHCLLKHLPVVIYAAHADRPTVKRAIEFRVQNFLLKPYREDDIFAALDQAASSPWRERLFEPEATFCQLMGLAPEQLRHQLDALATAIDTCRTPVRQHAALRAQTDVAHLIDPLRERASAAGAWGVADALSQLSTHAAENHWGLIEADLDGLAFAVQLIRNRLDPTHGALDFLDHDERDAELQRRERTRWLAAPAEGRCPVVPPEQLARELASLRGCPVIDTSAAAFQLAATGRPGCINPLMDLVARDPGLSTQMLAAANRLHPAAEDYNRIEDARLAVTQLGETALEAEGRNLVITPSRAFNLPPAFDWPQFWTFQRGVARIAQLICRDLEFYSLEQIARTAGQLHAVGKLILAHLHPAGFQATIEHARLHRVPLRESERLYFGTTTAEIGGQFAEAQGLSPRFARVMRWIDEPAAAPADQMLVAIISLARDLCRHNRVGASGDPMLEHPPPLEETPEWQILREGLYPSFNPRKFELKVHAYCGQIRTEFSGHQSGTVAELITTRAADPTG
jgi:CheY-like chemotaxis protein/HD-like signal output (HDOD) protein